jgi:plasmid maintenance system antidote protein VapI
MLPQNRTPTHPGEILLEGFLLPLGVSHYRLAKDIAVPPRRTRICPSRPNASRSY